MMNSLMTQLLKAGNCLSPLQFTIVPLFLGNKDQRTPSCRSDGTFGRKFS